MSARNPVDRGERSTHAPALSRSLTNTEAFVGFGSASNHSHGAVEPRHAQLALAPLLALVMVAADLRAK